MPKIDPRLDPYIELLRQSEGPIPISDISKELHVSQSTALRMINRLLDEGEIELVGTGRATRYRMVETYDHTIRIPVGIDARDIDEHVNLPILARVPIRYRPEFLDDYQPNVSRYLPYPVSDRLHQIGELHDLSLDSSVESKRMIEKVLIDLSFGSSKLEGIKTSYQATENLILKGRGVLTSEDRAEITMILNHKDAVQCILENLEPNESSMPFGFNQPTVYQMHALLMDGLLPDVDSLGKTRSRDVEIDGSTYKPLSIPTEIQVRLIKILAKCDEIKDPFEQSFFALVQIACLQSFLDGNKRTSRMMAIIPLLKSGLCPISFLGTPRDVYTAGLLGVYELNRTEMMRDVFVSTYEQSAHHIHRDKNRQTAPTSLEIYYRSPISEVVGEVVRQPDANNHLEMIDEWSGRFHDLESHEQVNLKHIVLEKRRKMTLAMRHIYKLTEEEFKSWDRRRPIYSNFEVVPTNSPALTPDIERKSASGWTL